jgi:phenylacetate-CoA ligase
MGSTVGYFIKNRKYPVKNFLYQIIPFKYRYGKKYLEFLNFLNKSKKWSYDQSKEYQLTKTRELLTYSNNNIPYYQNLFKINGFDYDIKHLDDLKQLPILTKEDVINNFNSLVNVNYLGKHYKMNSSGTTGKRLEILGTDDLFKIEAAFITNAFNDHGAKLYDQHSVWIRRYSPSEDEPIFFNDHELNRSYMSAFNLNDDTIFSYVDYINLTKTKILVSYPSTLYYFAVLCGKYGLKLKHVKHMHGASEVCLPQWRTKIKEILGIDIKMHYGQVEKVSFAHQDSLDDAYRENLLYGYNEYDNRTIIGTGFYNNLMPLIRYKTNDKIILNPDVVYDGCYPKTILDIEGRNGDMLITESASYVPAVNFYSFMSKINEVDMFQITQKKIDKSLTIYIIPNHYYTLDTEKKLQQEMKNRLGNIKIEIKKVKTIDRDINSNKLKTISLI